MSIPGATEISRMLADRIEPLCRELLPNGRAEFGNWRVGSLNGEPGGSFSIKLKHRPGQWCDFATNERGDALNLVRAVLGCDMAGALDWSRQWLGLGSLTNGRQRPPIDDEARRKRDADRAISEATEREQDAKRLLYVAAIWNGAGPIAGTNGEGYLARRGIVLDDVPDGGGLRWHPTCPWGVGTAPCIVARYTDAVTFEPRGIWRRPITGEKPKALGPTARCVIRLWPDDMIERGIVLGEGVETTLAAAIRITHRGTYLRPAWAAGFAGNMAAFPALPGIEVLTLLVDNDENGRGQAAAVECASRWADTGKEVIRLTPGECGADFNDLVKP
jgi:hypothetical protein